MMPIFYESRTSKLALNAAELPKLDAEFEELIEGEAVEERASQDKVGRACWWQPIWRRNSRSVCRR